MCNRDPNHSIPVKCTTIKGTKMKFTLQEAMKARRREYRYISTLSLTSMLDGVVVNATHQPLYLWTQDLVPIEQEAGWAPGPVWMGGENLVQVRKYNHYLQQSSHSSDRKKLQVYKTTLLNMHSERP